MEWIDLPVKKSCFTARNTAMIDLDKNRVVQYYSANTKIAVTQKCVTAKGTFYRTEPAKEKGLNWAFKATALGLPDKKAPLAPSLSPLGKTKSATRTPEPTQKQKTVQESALPKSGEVRHKTSWLKRLFRRGCG